MLVLFETPAGYAIFKLLDDSKLSEIDSLYEEFNTPEGASAVVKLKNFVKFEDTTEALAATTAAIEGKISKPLKKALKNTFLKKYKTSSLSEMPNLEVPLERSLIYNASQTPMYRSC